MYDIEQRAKKQRGSMAYCGYSHELAKAEGVQGALAVLTDGAAKTYDEDLRADERFQEALKYLGERIGETALLGQIRRALDIPRPEERRYTLEHLAGEVVKRHSETVVFDLPDRV